MLNLQRGFLIFIQDEDHLGVLTMHLLLPTHTPYAVQEILRDKQDYCSLQNPTGPREQVAGLGRVNFKHIALVFVG